MTRARSEDLIEEVVLVVGQLRVLLLPITRSLHTHRDEHVLQEGLQTHPLQTVAQQAGEERARSIAHTLHTLPLHHARSVVLAQQQADRGNEGVGVRLRQEGDQTRERVIQTSFFFSVMLVTYKFTSDAAVASLSV